MHTLSGRDLGTYWTTNGSGGDYCRVVIVSAVEKLFKFQPTLLPRGKLSDLYKMRHGARVLVSWQMENA